MSKSIGRRALTRRELMVRASAMMIAGGAAVSGAAWPRGMSALAADKLTYVTPFRYLIGFAPVMNAKTRGHFEAQDFDAEVIGGQGSAGAIQQVLAGQAKFSRVSSIDILKAIDKQDLPIVGISTMVQGSVFHVVSSKANPINTPQDLVGKTIGVVSKGGGTENLLDMMLAGEGIDPQTVERQVVGNSPGAFSLVEEGRIDAYIISIGPVVVLREMGKEMVAFSTDKFAPNPSQVYFCTKETADTEPDTVLRFLRAIRASVDELLADDVDPLIAGMVDAYDVIGEDHPEILKKSFLAERELWFSEGEENLMRNVPSLWENAGRLARKAGIADVEDVTVAYTNEFVDQI